MFWTSNKSSLVNAFVFAMCAAGMGLAQQWRVVFERRVKEIYTDVNYSMPFLYSLIPYTKEIVFGTKSCVFCKSYWKFLVNKAMYQRAEWKKYFKNLLRFSKRCFQYFCLFNNVTTERQSANLSKLICKSKQCFHFQIWMEFDFSSDKPNRPRRGPPARFAERMSKQSAAQESATPTPKLSENPTTPQLNLEGN